MFSLCFGRKKSPSPTGSKSTLQVASEQKKPTPSNSRNVMQQQQRPAYPSPPNQNMQAQQPPQPPPVPPQGEPQYMNPQQDMPQYGPQQELLPLPPQPKPQILSEEDGNPCVEVVATFFSFVLFILTFPFSVWYSIKVVQEYERAVIFRLGRIRTGGARGPGTFFVLPCIDEYRSVDLRTVTYDVPPQLILSKDSVTVQVDAVVFYRVSDPIMAVKNVMNYAHSTGLLSATILRNVLGTKSLAELLSERESIVHTMQTALDEATDPWGVKVERVEITDVRLPPELQRAMAAEAEAARDARAKVIAAEGEMKASRALKEASEVMVGSPGALQLRYLQTLTTIASERNSTIIFPLPIELLSAFSKR